MMSSLVVEPKSPPSGGAASSAPSALLRNPAVWLIGAAFVPGLVAYFAQLWDLEHYQFFPFALAGAAALAHRARQEPFQGGTPSTAWWSLAMLVGLGLLAGSVLFGSPWAAYAGALVTLLGVLYGAGGAANVVRFLPALVMLLVILRPPLNMDVAAIKKLQQVTARAAGTALDVLNVTYVRAGNVIEIPGKRLFVEEACSGVNSLFSALACTVFYLLWTRRHPFVWLMLLLSLPFWVLTANAGRITLVALLRYRWGIAADSGWRHDFLGYLVFAVAMFLLFATERLLSFYAAVIPPEDEFPTPGPLPAKAPPAATDTARSLSPRLWLLPAALACVLLVLQLPALAREVRDRSQAAAHVRLEVFDEAFLPAKTSAGERKKFEVIDRNRASAFGEHSQLWQYQGTAQRTSLSLDYPFVGWHELTECYESQGWNVENRATGEAADGLSYVTVSMQHPLTGRHGRLWFAMLTHDGRSLAVRKHGEVDELRDRLAARLREQLSWTGPADDDDDWTYQVQMFAESYEPPTEATAAENLSLFVDFARRLQQHWSPTAP